MKRIIIVLFLFIFVGCESEIVNPKLNEEFEIKYGDSKKIESEDLNIKFLSVISDSRCPEGMACQWPGNAEIKFQINSEEIILNTFLEPKEKEVSKYKIKLLRVLPIPKQNQETNLNEYTCKIIVSKI